MAPISFGAIMSEQDMAKKFIPRDISWLSFNARVLQEAAEH